MTTQINNSLTIEVPAATPGRHLIGEQAQLRGKKILAILAAGVGSGKSPLSAPALAAQDMYLQLITASGKIMHDGLPVRALQDALTGGLLLGVGQESIDWSKSYVISTGGAVAGQVAALTIIY